MSAVHVPRPPTYLCVGDAGVNSVELWDFAAVTREPLGAGCGRFHGLFQEFFLHALLVFVLQLCAVFNALLCVTECSLLQLPHHLGVVGALLGGDRVQIPYSVHVSSYGSHVQRRVVVVV